MTLRRISILSIIVGAVIFTLVMLPLYQNTLVSHIENLEEQTLQDDLTRLAAVIDDRLEGQGKLTADYAHWVDCYEFINNLNKDFVTSNMTWANLQNLNIEHIIFLDSSENVRAHMGVDLNSPQQDSLEIPAGLLEKIHFPPEQEAVLRTRFVPSLLTVHGKVWMVSTSAITLGEDTTQRNGFLVFARTIDANTLADMSEHLQVPLQLFSGASLPSRISELTMTPTWAHYGHFFKGATHVGDKERVIDGYWLLPHDSTYFKIEHKRRIEQSGIASLRLFSALVAISVLILMIGFTVFLHKLVVAYLNKFEQRFSQIEKTGDLSIRMPIAGAKEIQEHAQSINRTLDSLQAIQKELTRSEKEQRNLAAELTSTQSFLTRLIDFLPEATFAVDVKGSVVAWNLAMESLTKVPCSQMLGKRVEDIALLLYGKRRTLLLEKFFNPALDEATFIELETKPNGSLGLEEFVANQETNQGRFLQHTAMSLQDSQGEFLGAVQMVRDVTDQKRAEMRMEFLSLHDPLTGLYNRTYYSEASKGWSLQSNLPLGVIMIDLDGLKLVNDTLGHEHGDALILAAATIFKCVFDENPVARIGGDEFVILFARCPESFLQRSLAKLNDQIQKYNSNLPPIPVQMSIGFAWSDHKHSLEELVKEADALMYREKDTRREAVRTSYVYSLQQRFEELHRKDIDSVQRLITLAHRFSNYLRLPAEEMEKLQLLAKFRDIGKVGITERIMNKPGNLEVAEKEEMQKQPEIGYRIARLSQELTPIADLILRHREWWDGRGYPLGISGDRIPLLNRILAVVETYVAMTSPRIRSRTSSSDIALEEIRLMAGKKLDPKLVDDFCTFLELMQ